VGDAKRNLAPPPGETWGGDSCLSEGEKGGRDRIGKGDVTRVIEGNVPCCPDRGRGNVMQRKGKGKRGITQTWFRWRIGECHHWGSPSKKLKV